MLLQHRIFTWFPTQISEITVCSLDSLSSYADEDFDLIFCTEEVRETSFVPFPSISVFPDSRDFEMISSSINGYKDVDDILRRFSPSCFYYGKVSDKNKALSIVCDNAKKAYELPDNFYDEILAHEDMANSYFGNMIAIPHPMTPLSKETFASVAVLEKPIRWDATHDVQLIILVSIEKDNPPALQFWYSVSSIIKNTAGLNAFFKDISYENFLLFLRDSLIMNRN